MALIVGDQNLAQPNDKLNGTTDADTILGLTGNDSLSGRAGDDSLEGGIGNDTLLGEEGDDLLSGGDGDDLLYAGDSDSQDADTLLGGAGADTFNVQYASFGAVSLDGGDGADTILLGSSPSSVAPDPHAVTFVASDASIEKVVIIGHLRASNQSDIVDFSGSHVTYKSMYHSFETYIGQIRLLGGNDTFIGGADDTVIIGDTVNTIFGDSVFGGDGNDFLSSGAKSDWLSGDSGDDTLIGGDWNDSLSGGAGIDELSGGEGDDYLSDRGSDGGKYSGGDGFDTLGLAATGQLGGLVLDVAASIENFGVGGGLVQGTDAANLFDVSGVINSDVKFLAGGGGDTLIGGDSANEFNGQLGNDLLEGGGGADTLVGGGGGTDSLIGGDGDDLLILTGGENFDGGAGTDTARVDAVSGNLSFAGKSVERVIFKTGAIGLEVDNVLDLTGIQALLSASGLNLLGGNDAFIGGASGERISGGVGDDTLSGFGGADSLSGEAGDDRILGGIDGDSLYGGAGDDTIDGGDAGDLLDGGAGDDSLVGGAGFDTLVGGGGSDLLDGGADNDVFRLAGSGALTIRGGDGADRVEIVGGVALARLVLNAAASVETVDFNGQPLRGSTGDDVFDMTGVASYVDGNGFALGTGNDRFKGGAQGESVDGGGGDDRLDGGAGFDTLSGGGGDDTLVGSGLDSLIGGGGNDVYISNAATEVIFEQASGGKDELRSTVTRTLDANVENLKLTGRGEIDGTGNGAANLLVGNAAANALAGGLGADTLTGGGGADEFVFDARLGGGNVDRVTDFGRGGDTLLLDVAIFADIDAGRLDREAFVVGTAAADRSDRIIYDDATGRLFYDRDGTGRAKAVEFARLDDAPDLTHRDIIVG